MIPEGTLKNRRTRSQKAQILEYLETGRTLTFIQAFDLFGCRPESMILEMILAMIKSKLLWLNMVLNNTLNIAIQDRKDWGRLRFKVISHNV